MRLPLQVSYDGIARSPALDDLIAERTAKLEHFHPTLVGCRVTVTQPGRHQSQGRLINVRIDLTVPEREIAVTRAEHEDAFVAVREAFDTARRLLQQDAQTHRDVRPHA